MKALKGVLTYVGIVLLGIIVIASLTIGLMFFTKGSVFGYYFMQVNTDGTLVGSYDVEVKAPNAEQLSIHVTTNRYSVRFIPHEGKTIDFHVDNHYIGFLDADNVNKETKKVIAPTLLLQEKTVNGVKTVIAELNEPQGALSVSKISRLTVHVPYQVSSKVIKYNITANTGYGNVDITNSSKEVNSQLVEFPINVVGLNISTGRGNVTINGVGDENGVKDVLTLSSLNIKTEGGTFDFTSFKKISVESKINLSSKKATYKFNELESFITKNNNTGGIEIIGDNVKFTARKVVCGSDGFIYKAETGALNIDQLISGSIVEESKEVDKLDGEGKVVKDGHGNAIKVTVYKHTKINVPYENTIFANSSEINLGVVVGKLGLYSEYGNVYIGVLSNQASMTTENGNIYIGTSGTLLNEYDSGDAWESNKRFSETSSLILFSTYGDITVKEYYQDAVLYSKKGKIFANSRYHGNKTGINSRYYYSNISSKDGQITATTEGNPMMIEGTGSSTIKLTVSAMKPFVENLMPTTFGENMYKATSSNGKVIAKFPMQTFGIKVQAKTIVGSIGSTSSFGETYTYINPPSQGTIPNTTPHVYLSARRVELDSSI